MVSPAWQNFIAEIARWRESGQQVDFWWRDDDACRPDPALTRLITLANRTAVPLALAVIPGDARADAFDPASAMVSVLQHGIDHRTRAAAGEKKTEFSAAEPVHEALKRLLRGRTQLEQLVGTQALPVLVPPWNRISAPQLVEHLAGAGYRGLSCFGPRRSRYAAPGVVLVNTHVDIIDWRGSRGFVGEDIALELATRHLQARRSGLADAGEPTGWLTHHAVHDEAAWAFMERLLELTGSATGVSWLGAPAIFGS